MSRSTGCTSIFFLASRVQNLHFYRVGLDDNVLIERVGAWGSQYRSDAVAPSTLTHKGDLVGIASKCSNVVLHPFEGHDLIARSQVAWCLRGRDTASLVLEDSQDSKPVIHRHDNDTTSRHQITGLS